MGHVWRSVRDIFMRLFRRFEDMFGVEKDCIDFSKPMEFSLKPAKNHTFAGRTVRIAIYNLTKSVFRSVPAA